MKKYITPKDFEIAAKNGIKKDTVIIDEEIVNNSNSNIETVVKAGERIGRVKEKV